MTRLVLGANLTFALKRWPLAEDWARLLHEAGLTHAQFCFDLEDPMVGGGPDAFGRIREDAERHEVTITSAFTGTAVYSQNFLAHPDPGRREQALIWMRHACAAAAALGGTAVGGHWGAMSVADHARPAVRRERTDALLESVVDVSRSAAESGLEALLWEVNPVIREFPASFDDVDELYERVDHRVAVPVELCLDLGHACRAGAPPAERDPFQWLGRYGSRCRSVHLQQSDGVADRHWPFTPETDSAGIIEPARVIDSVRASGRETVELMLEPIPAPEVPDDEVRLSVGISAARWRTAIGADTRR